jgi:hypothetical protein
MHEPGDPSLEAAWAALRPRWEDREAHLALLAGCTDLPALAELGRRYRTELEARPTDALALEMKGEILKRATIVGLAQLPRTRLPDVQAGPWPRRLLLAGAGVLAVILTWVVGQLLRGLPS